MNNSSINPIIILVGHEPFLIEREIARLISSVVPKELASFNLDRFSAKTDSLSRVLDVCAQFPMMAQKRLVLLRDADSLKKDDHERLLEYFESPQETTVFLLVASKIDNRLKVWKSASRFVREMKVPYSNEMPGWIVREASQLGLKLSQDAAFALAQTLGSSLMAAINALEQLKTYVAPRTEVALSDVEATVGGFFSKTVFELADRVGNRNYREASLILENMVLQGEPFVRILFMLNRHFRLLFLARQGLDQNSTPAQMASTLGVPPFFVKDYVQQAKKLPLPFFKRIYNNLLSADRALKGSRLSPKHVMDRFLMQACLS